MRTVIKKSLTKKKKTASKTSLQRLLSMNKRLFHTFKAEQEEY